MYRGVSACRSGPEALTSKQLLEGLEIEKEINTNDLSTSQKEWEKIIRILDVQMSVFA